MCWAIEFLFEHNLLPDTYLLLSRVPPLCWAHREHYLSISLYVYFMYHNHSDPRQTRSMCISIISASRLVIRGCIETAAALHRKISMSQAFSRPVSSISLSTHRNENHVWHLSGQLHWRKWVNALKLYWVALSGVSQRYAECVRYSSISSILSLLSQLCLSSK